MADLKDIIATALTDAVNADTREATQIRDALTRLYDSMKQYIAWEAKFEAHGVEGRTTLQIAKGNVITHLTLLVQVIESIASQKIALSNEAPRQIAETVVGGIIRALYVVLSDFVRGQL